MIPEPYNYVLAAFGIDFEGSIQLNRRIKPKTHTIRYDSQITIEGTSRELLVAFKDAIGFGHFFPSRTNREEGAETQRWTMNVQEMREILPKIEPYLTAKQEQAHYLIRAHAILKTREQMDSLSHEDKQGMYTLEETEELDFLHDRMRELNERPFKKMSPLTDTEKLLLIFRRKGLR
jgi:hypothetical protein